MSDNPFVKPLNLFDPKENLEVNESFKSYGINARSDTLSDLESDDMEEDVNSTTGKEFCSAKTGGAILGGLVEIEDEQNRHVLMAGNKKGEIVFLIPEAKSFKTISKFRIQGSIVRKPAYADGIIYCTTREGGIYAIHADLSGNVKASKPKIYWQKKLSKGILTEPISTGKILIVASLDGLYGFEAYFNGKENKSIGRPLWAQKLDGVVSTPNVHSGVIYIGTEDKKVYAFGYGGSKISKIWVHEASDAIRMKPCVSQKNDMLLISTVDGFVYALDRKSGKYKWNFIVRAPVLSNIVSAIIGNNEYFYFGADNGIFYCINSAGKKVWEFKTNDKIRTEALADKGRIYFGSEDNNFYALNIKNGKQIFKFSTDGNINGKPILKDDLIFFGSTDSFVHGVHV